MVRVENNFRRVWIAGGWGLYGLMSGNRRSMRKNERVNVHIALRNVQWRLLSSKMAKNIDKKISVVLKCSVICLLYFKIIMFD